MKKIFTFATLLCVGFLLHSCGGVVGNIEKYQFRNVDTSALKAALDKVYAKHPALINSDNTLYGKNNGADSFYVLKDGGEKIVFQCSVLTYQPTDDKDTDLSLTTATTWGEIMRVAPKMSSSEKRKYRRLFEKIFYPRSTKN